MTEAEWKTRKKRIDPKLDAVGWGLPRGRGKPEALGPQNVLTQAERYARGLRGSKLDFDGLRCPFLYSTNGEVIWFHDARHQLNRSRRISNFHTPSGLRELLGRDLDDAWRVGKSSGGPVRARCPGRAAIYGRRG